MSHLIGVNYRISLNSPLPWNIPALIIWLKLNEIAPPLNSSRTMRMRYDFGGHGHGHILPREVFKEIQYTPTSCCICSKVAAISDYALHIKLAAMKLSDDSVLQRYIYTQTYTPFWWLRYLLQSTVRGIAWNHIHQEDCCVHTHGYFRHPSRIFMLKLVCVLTFIPIKLHTPVSRQHEFVDHYPLHIVRLRSEHAGWSTIL